MQPETCHVVQDRIAKVEQSMRLRRARLLSALQPGEIAPTVVSFPLMGVGDFVRPAAPPGGRASCSTQVPDSCINPHPRFGTLTANIRSRRGSKALRAPLCPDFATSPLVQDPGVAEKWAVTQRWSKDRLSSVRGRCWVAQLPGICKNSVAPPVALSPPTQRRSRAPLGRRSSLRSGVLAKSAAATTRARAATFALHARRLWRPGDLLRLGPILE